MWETLSEPHKSDIAGWVLHVYCICIALYCIVCICVIVYLLKYGVHKYSMPMHSFTQKTCFSARSARSGYEGYPNWE